MRFYTAKAVSTHEREVMEDELVDMAINKFKEHRKEKEELDEYTEMNIRNAIKRKVRVGLEANLSITYKEMEKIRRGNGHRGAH